MTVRSIATAFALSAALTLAACTSTTSGSGKTHGPSGSAASPTTSAALAALMESGISQVKSARIDLDVSISGQPLTGSGAEKLDSGKLVALDVTEHLPAGAGDIRIIVVNGDTYAKLPAALNSTGKPYLRVTSDSSNPVIQQLSSSMDSALASASLGSVADFARAAKSFRFVGPATVRGVATTHYSIVVEIDKLPDDLPGKKELLDGGVKSLPLELFIDKQGRPIQVTENADLQGQKIQTKVGVRAYDEPVTITAPPADQIGN
jgi:hypothetical protein